MTDTATATTPTEATPEVGILAVWKFTLAAGLSPEPQFVTMPQGAKIVLVGVQHGLPMLWAEVDPTAEVESRAFYALPTGVPIPVGAAHIGSELSAILRHVVHFYEQLTPLSPNDSESN